MAAFKVGGVAFLKVNGTQYLLRGDLTVTVNTLKRTTVVGQDGVHGYTEEVVAAQIKATLTDTGGLSIPQFQQMTDVTVTAELNNEKVYILPNAWTTGVEPLNTSEGSLAVTWEANTCEELLAA